MTEPGEQTKTTRICRRRPEGRATASVPYPADLDVAQPPDPCSCRPLRVGAPAPGLGI